MEQMDREGNARDQLVSKSGRGRAADIFVLCFLPWINFSLVASLIAFVSDDVSVIAWVAAALCALVALLLIAIGTRQKRPSHLALGVLVLVAVGMGVPTGLLVQSDYMSKYWSMGNGATYVDVDAAEPALSYADATSIVFSDRALVNIDRTLGYMRAGTVFCVAPVMTSSQNSTPQFWAVGTDCCEQRGKFTCGDAAEDKAHSGIVFRKSRSAWDHYRTAVRMAEATYEMEPQPASLFVEWTTSASDFTDSLFVDAVSVVAIASLLHFLASLAAAIMLSRYLPPKK